MSITPNYFTIKKSGYNIVSHKIPGRKSEQNVFYIPYATKEQGIGASKGKSYADS